MDGLWGLSGVMMRFIGSQVQISDSLVYVKLLSEYSDNEPT